VQFGVRSFLPIDFLNVVHAYILSQIKQNV
jgi:hypothetical protein